MSEAELIAHYRKHPVLMAVIEDNIKFIRQALNDVRANPPLKNATDEERALFVSSIEAGERALAKYRETIIARRLS